jgi:glycosyltransferase involved in cell wall biosynthesis
MLLSLCMIVKNEEENIKECLDKALEYVDEAIIVDTGSTDSTRNILQEYENLDKVTVIDYVWDNDFSKARNKSIENAKGDYILILDADERIFCDRLKLEEFLLENNELAYTIAIYNVYENQEMVVSSGMIRLYKNQNPFYTGAIHEQLEIDGKKHLGASIDDKICKIYHFGYSRNAFRVKGKQKRNMDIINAEIERNPKEPFNWYNKGVMEMIAGNLDVAIDDFIKAHELCNGHRMSYHIDLVIRMIQCMLMQKKYKQVINFINNLVKDPEINKMPDIYYYMGICFKEIKKYELAIKNFRKAIEIGDTTKGISKFGSGSYLPMLEWANILRIEKKFEQSIEKYEEAVFHHNNIKKQGFSELKQLLLKKNRIDEIEKLEERLSLKDSNAKEQDKIKDELESYKEEFKEKMQSLIQKGLLEDTKKAIQEYERFIEDDVDMYSMKGVIAMMEGNMEQAEEILKRGLNIYSGNFDLEYNLGYLYQSIGKEELARDYFEKALKNARDENCENEVYEQLERLGIKEDRTDSF